MLRRTLGDVRQTISRVLQLKNSASSDVVRDRINEAQERLIDRGKFPGMEAIYSFCTYQGSITLPRELDAILGFDVDKSPKHIRNMWYEFLDGGPGKLQYQGWGDAIDRGLTVTFNDLSGVRYIRVYADAVETSGSQILIRGINQYGNRVMTYDSSGALIDGEYVNLVGASPAVTVNQFALVDSVVKPQTSGFVRLYEYDGYNQSAIAIYHPNETAPVYRRYSVPGLQPNPSNPEPSSHTITVLGKRRFIPAYAEVDDLMITNIAALKNMVMAIEYEENNDPTNAQTYEQRALDNLNSALKEYQGGARATPNIVVRGSYGGEVRQTR